MRGIREFIDWGSVPELEEKRLCLPAGLPAMLSLPGLDHGLVRRLWREAGILSVPQLRRACFRGGLDGLGILDADGIRRLCVRLESKRDQHGPWLRACSPCGPEAWSERWLSWAGLERVALAGEARRAGELLDRLVWVAAAPDPEFAFTRLAALPGAEFDREPPDRIRLPGDQGPAHDIVIVDPAHHAARLFLETGSRAHCEALLARLAAGSPHASAEDLGLPATEEAIYASAGLPWIPPELREGRGEIDRAAGEGVPRLIRDSDLRGAFHLHTLWSDGRAAIAAYARAARALGWRYLGIADHAQSAFCGGGLSPERLALQAREIAQVGRELPEVRIFHGIECDIDLDGGLAYDASLLASLDFVVISLHAVGGMDRDQLTARTIRALHHPAATILAHPSGRLLRERPGCPLNWQRLFAEAAAAGVLIEYNTSPDRLDLDWRLIRAATSRGAGICVNPDAHRLEALGAIPAALETARKGWLSPEQVFNTLPLETVEERLHARRARQS